MAQLLQRFNDEARLEGTYFFAKQDSLLKLANLVERIDNLSLEDRQVLLGVCSENAACAGALTRQWAHKDLLLGSNFPACCSFCP